MLHSAHHMGPSVTELILVFHTGMLMARVASCYCHASYSTAAVANDNPSIHGFAAVLSCTLSCFCYSSVLWTKYGLLKADTTLFFVNSAGALMSINYIIIFYIYTSSRVWSIALYAVFVLVIYQYTPFFNRDSSKENDHTSVAQHITWDHLRLSWYLCFILMC